MIFLDASKDYLEKRRNLILSLQSKKELDEKVLDVMGKIPRELFVSPVFINRAYEDTALPIDCSQTISQPYTVAFMTTLLKVKPGDRILEVGTGSGYQATVLFMLQARVFSVERVAQLYEQTSKMFKKNGINVMTRLSDGTLGWKEFSPFDGIIVTAAAPEAPRSLLDQLAIGGRMIIPIGDRVSQDMYIIERNSEQDYATYKADKFKFVPLIGKEGWKTV